MYIFKPISFPFVLLFWIFIPKRCIYFFSMAPWIWTYILSFYLQGSLLQILQDKGKSGRGRLGSFSTTFKESKKELVRQVFLFTNHMLLTTRASNGRLHLAKVSNVFKCFYRPLLQSFYKIWGAIWGKTSVVDLWLTPQKVLENDCNKHLYVCMYIYLAGG